MITIFFKQKKILLGVATIPIALGGIFYAYKHKEATPCNLYETLDYYGFKTPEQKLALHYLMQQADIEDADALLDPKHKNQADLGKMLFKFVSKTQEKFTIRTGSQERWEVETSEWMKNLEQQAKTLNALKVLNMLDVIPSSFKKSNAICILGASKIIMDSRIEHAATLVKNHELQAQYLIMLAGERYVTADKNGKYVDGSEAYLNKLAQKFGKNINMLTETDLMKESFESSELYTKFKDHSMIIDTPRHDLPRPTTETTVTELCKWLKAHPEIKKISFVSSQPHVEYQKAIIAQVFKKCETLIEFEVIGPKYNSELLTQADNINYLMQALGSRIWAQTPSVMDAIKLNISDDLELCESFMSLYKKLPLIYANLENKFYKSKLRC